MAQHHERRNGGHALLIVLLALGLGGCTHNARPVTHAIAPRPGCILHSGLSDAQCYHIDPVCHGYHATYWEPLSPECNVCQEAVTTTVELLPPGNDVDPMQWTPSKPAESQPLLPHPIQPTPPVEQQKVLPHPVRQTPAVEPAPLLPELTRRTLPNLRPGPSSEEEQASPSADLPERPLVEAYHRPLPAVQPVHFAEERDETWQSRPAEAKRLPPVDTPVSIAPSTDRPTSKNGTPEQQQSNPASDPGFWKLFGVEGSTEKPSDARSEKPPVDDWPGGAPWHLFGLIDRPSDRPTVETLLPAQVTLEPILLDPTPADPLCRVALLDRPCEILFQTSTEPRTNRLPCWPRLGPGEASPDKTA